MYTLKLDWNSTKIEVTRKALQAVTTGEIPATEEERQAAGQALEEISLYRETVEEVIASHPVPPPDVLARKTTPEDVRKYPYYFITGPGQEIASTTECDHGYFLTDSCPGCP